MPQEEAPLDVKAASWATDAHVTLKSHTSAQLLRKPSTLLSHPAALPGEGLTMRSSAPIPGIPSSCSLSRNSSSVWILAFMKMSSSSDPSDELDQRKEVIAQ
jgi:hypothetical protein